MRTAGPARRSKLLAGCCLLAGALLACSDAQPPPSPVRRSVESITRELFVPLTADFERDARAVDVALKELCRARDDRGLQAARDAWDAAAVRFEYTEVMAFGPHTLSPWRLGARIDFWPAREKTIEDQLARFGAGAAAAGADGGVSDAGTAVPPGRDGGVGSADGLGAAARGLPVIEYLLFAGGDDAVRAAFDDVAQAAARCAYLRALGAGLVDDSSALHAAWSGPFGRDLTLVEGPNEHYASVRDGFGEIVNGLAFAVEVLSADELAKPLGGSKAGAHPESVEARYAGRSIEHALATLRGVELVFLGAYGEHRALGIGGLLQLRGRDMSSRFTDKLAAARRALLAIDGPLDEAVVDDRDGVQRALDALGELLVFLQVDVTQALAVTVTFGGGDGD